jgi:hypothetical protein
VNKVGLGQVFHQALKFSFVNYDFNKTTTPQAIYSRTFHNVSGSRQDRTRVIFPVSFSLPLTMPKFYVMNAHHVSDPTATHTNPPLNTIISISIIISAETKWKSCQIGTSSEM